MDKWYKSALRAIKGRVVGYYLDIMLRYRGSIRNMTSSAKVISPGIDAINENDVLFQNVNNTKIITLNRPKKLNSLDYSMLSKIYPRLKEYSKADTTQLIIQKSNGRAFCAGGDVSSCVENNLAGKFKDSLHFFQQEYSMNYLLATFNKPIVSFMDGITMGGGVGLSVHTPFRIATENTRWAMPEMDIGFSPDVGATFALNKLIPSSLGWYLALTGEQLYSWDVYFSGVATHFVPAKRLDELQQKLTELDLPKEKQDQYNIVNNIIEEFVELVPENYKFKYGLNELIILERIFRPNTNMENIFNELEEDGSDFAIETLKTLKKKSPLSLKVGLEILQRGQTSNIYEALKNELNAATIFMQNSDFNEGVSSKLIRKSKDIPNWRHKSIKDVGVEEVLPFFKPSPLLLERHSNVAFNQYPYNFGLPREDEIKALLKGSTGLTKIQTLPQLIQHYKDHPQYGDKAGLQKYLESVWEKLELLKTNIHQISSEDTAAASVNPTETEEPKL